MTKKYFITGIGTDIGKTVIAAILTEALQADYWKPVQAGDLHYSDTDKVKQVISNSKSLFHANTYALKEPASPHYSAALEDIEIDLNQFKLPKTNNHLIIEGAGGIMVPLNSNQLISELIKKFSLEVILVANSYLGSINHTLLTIEFLKHLDVPIKGIIFNGTSNSVSEDYILNYTSIKLLGRVAKLQEVNKEQIRLQAKQFEFLKND